jgi:KUP system potassium uptake protein
LTVAALGVVFGDIGTSPLYALKTCFQSAHAMPTPGNVLGILSLIVWALIVVVCVKYVSIVMRVDHDGQGGILALLALLLPKPDRGMPARATWIVVVVVIGAGMLFGDGVITPAISVISAVEGLGVATSSAQPWIVPISLAIVIGLFVIQVRGTEKVGALFGPVMLVWFVVIAVAGIAAIAAHPAVLWAIDPRHGVIFATHHGVDGFRISRTSDAVRSRRLGTASCGRRSRSAISARARSSSGGRARSPTRSTRSPAAHCSCRW